jgi:hypothetical protein
MARIVTPVSGTPISASTFGAALRNDYVSQTDTVGQACASNLTFASTKKPIYGGGTHPFVTVGQDAGCDYVTDGTADEVQINEALASLTSGRTWIEKLVIIGNNTIADSILVDPYTEIELIGKINCVNNLNKSLVTFSDVTNQHIDIHGGEWFGNGANQSGTADMFHFGVGSNFDTRIHNLHIGDVKGWGIYMDGSQRVFVHDIDMLVDGGTLLGGLYLHYVSDSTFHDIIIGCYGDTTHCGLQLRYTGGGTFFSNIYIGGGSASMACLTMQAALQNKFTNLHISDSSGNGISFDDVDTDYCFENSFMGGTILRTCTGTDETYDCIQLNGHSHRNIFSGFNLSSPISANKPRYGFNEAAATCNYNIISGSTFQNCKTANTRIQGANSVNANNC